MKKTAMIAVVALLALGQSGIAQQNPAETKVNPGNEGTKAMGEQVPTMKADCPESSEVDTKAPGTEATEAMSDKVPTMTADAGDCDNQDKTKRN